MVREENDAKIAHKHERIKDFFSLESLKNEFLLSPGPRGSCTLCCSEFDDEAGGRLVKKSKSIEEKEVYEES